MKTILNNIVFLKINSSLVQKIVNKKKKQENEQIKSGKKENKSIITKRKRKGSKNLKNKQKQKKQDTNPLYIEIRKDAELNHKKVKKKSKNMIVNINNDNKTSITTQNKNSIIQLNENFDISVKDIEENSIKLNNQQIYEIYLQINNYTSYELNFLSYQEALKKDKRTLCIYYISLIRAKHLLFFSFIKYFNYNSRTIKLFLFFFDFSTYFFVNSLFFDDATMHKIYEENGSFNFIYNLPHIIYSLIICGIINSLIKTLALSNNQFIQLKQNLDEEQNNIHERAKRTFFILKIKFLFFFAISLILLLFFWFYLSCFCAVYKNTQLHLIKDTVISFCTSMIYPFGIYILPAFFRIKALKEKNNKYMFNFSKLLQSL